MKKSQLLLKITVFSILIFSFFIAGTINREQQAEAKETVYKEGDLLYWRFDDGAEEQTVRMNTYNVPVNFTYTYTNKSEDPIPYSAATSYYTYDSFGTQEYYLNTLLGAGVVKELGDVNHSAVFYKDKVNYLTWRKYNESHVDIYNVPVVITNNQVLTYKVNYEGNAILVPCDSLDFATNVQGEEVLVSSDDNVKLEFAITKPGAKTDSITYQLSTNKVTVRLEAEYTYTRLVPLTSGSFTEYISAHDSINSYYICENGNHKDGAGNLIKHVLISHSSDHSALWTLPYGTKAPTNHISCSSGYMQVYQKTPCYTSNVTDYRSGNIYPVYSTYPVTSVKETLHYYKDVECYVIDTNEIKSVSKDMNIYLKDLHKSSSAVEQYSFVKSKTKFTVKYSYPLGFTVSGITRNTDINWIHNTNPVISSIGLKGELIEWWPGSSTVHYYTTPDRINDDIDVSVYMDYGATLYFVDANKPNSVSKVKIPARSKAPKVTFEKGKDGSSYIRGLKANTTALRICRNDDTYMALPTALTTGTGALFGRQYLADKDEITAEFGDPSFYVYTGASSTKDKLSVNDLLGINSSKNLNAFDGMYVEVQTPAKGKSPASAISAIYINEQPIFDVEESNTQQSIVLRTGYITVKGADSNNAYEYSVLDANGNYTEWKNLKSSAEKKDAAIIDGATVCIRKKALETNDATFFLPSTYIMLTYDGQGAGIPNSYYMDDYYVNESVDLELYNDTDHNITINSSITLYPGRTYILSDTFSNARYSIKNGRLEKEIVVAAAITTPTESFSNFTKDKINLSELSMGMTDITTTNASYTAYSSSTAAFDYYDGRGICHTIPVYYTPADATAYSITYETEKGSITCHPVHLLRKMMTE